MKAPDRDQNAIKRKAQNDTRVSTTHEKNIPASRQEKRTGCHCTLACMRGRRARRRDLEGKTGRQRGCRCLRLVVQRLQPSGHRSRECFFQEVCRGLPKVRSTALHLSRRVTRTIRLLRASFSIRVVVERKEPQRNIESIFLPRLDSMSQVSVGRTGSVSTSSYVSCPTGTLCAPSSAAEHDALHTHS